MTRTLPLSLSEVTERAYQTVAWCSRKPLTAEALYDGPTLMQKLRDENWSFSQLLSHCTLAISSDLWSLNQLTKGPCSRSCGGKRTFKNWSKCVLKNSNNSHVNSTRRLRKPLWDDLWHTPQKTICLTVPRRFSHWDSSTQTMFHLGTLGLRWSSAIS